jgi:hypothetical protein
MEQTPRDRFIQQLASTVDEHGVQEASIVLNTYRPQLITKFGEALAAQVLDHPGLFLFLSAVDHALDPDEAVRSAVSYLREHPEATPADAFTNTLNSIGEE